MRFVIRLEANGIIPREDFADSLGAKMGSFSSLGCFATRLVEASSKEEAVLKAEVSLREEILLNIAKHNTRKFFVVIESVRYLRFLEKPNAPTKGFTFFLE